ncbi:MAG: hypothetical protein QOF44_3968 [Streptomyces sp.]|nr:hypothetical protein [Streptomyces sp.]
MKSPSCVAETRPCERARGIPRKPLLSAGFRPYHTGGGGLREVIQAIGVGRHTGMFRFRVFCGVPPRCRWDKPRRTPPSSGRTGGTVFAGPPQPDIGPGSRRIPQRPFSVPDRRPDRPASGGHQRSISEYCGPSRRVRRTRGSARAAFEDRSGLAHAVKGDRGIDGDTATGAHALEAREHPGPELLGEVRAERFDKSAEAVGHAPVPVVPGVAYREVLTIIGGQRIEHVEGSRTPADGRRRRPQPGSGRRYDLSRPQARPWLYGIVINLVGRHRGRRPAGCGRCRASPPGVRFVQVKGLVEAGVVDRIGERP